MTAARSRRATLFAALLALGCGGGKGGPPETATVTGKVTLAGKPLPGGRIDFVGTDGTGSGMIKADGTYEATGVSFGECKVSVDNTSLKGVRSFPPGTENLPGVAETKGQKYVPIPVKYTKPETSGLSTTVVGKTHTYDAELK